MRAVAGVALVALVLLLAALVDSARAAPSIDQFTTGVSPGALPAAATFDGSVWFGEVGPSGVLGRIDPDGTVVDVPSSGEAPSSDPTGMAAAGGVLYVAAEGALYRVTPDGDFTRLRTGLRPGACVFELASAPDGSVWFTDDGAAGAIGRIAPDGTISETSAGLTPGSDPHALAVGPDGSVWFTELRGPGLGRLAPDGTISEIPGAHGTPLQIAAGPDGAMWFTEYDGFTGIGRVSGGGTVTEFALPGIPLSIAAGDDGLMYFTEPFSPQAIGTISPAGDIVADVAPSATLQMPWSIVQGADGNMWFTELGPPGAIGRLTTAPGIGPGVSAPAGPGAATLGAALRTHDQDTSYSFQYGWTPDYGLQTPAAQTPGAITSTSVGATVDGLQPGATYHFRLVATNAAGTTVGPDQTVTAGTAVVPDVHGGGTTPQQGSSSALGGAGDAAGSLTAPPAPTAGASSSGPLTLGRRVIPISGPDGGVADAPLAPLRSPAIRQGHTIGLGTVAGIVYARPPHSRHRIRLGAGTLLPVGTLVDARRGVVTLTAAQGGGAAGARIAADPLEAIDLSGGMFVVSQSPSDGGAVSIGLRGGSFGGCVAASRSSHAVHRRRARRGHRPARHHRATHHRRRTKHRPARHRRRPAHRRHRRRNSQVVRQLWSRDSGGNFSTHGRDSVGTVQGTLWLTQDRCDGTLTRVTRGVVSVKPFHAHGPVLVRAGHHYLAPAR